MAFLYSLLLTSLSPVAGVLLLLVIALTAERRPRLRRSAVALAFAVLLVCGNGWVTDWLVRNLEWRHVPAEPMPTADAILVLSGGILPATAPRRTVEVADAGDRVLHAAELFRQGRAPQIIATGYVGTGGIARRPEAEDMADLLVSIGVPRASIVLETRAQNTHEHAVNLCPAFREQRIGRVLLVTSAMHMPRSLGVFRRSRPAVDYLPAPTDFRATEPLPAGWYRQIGNLLPTPGRLLTFSEVTHEYVGMWYYRARGWM